VCACGSAVRQIYRTSVVSWVCVVLNSGVSVGVGIGVWLVYKPPADAAPTVLYGVFGGLQLWTAFFANVVLLVGKARTAHA